MSKSPYPARSRTMKAGCRLPERLSSTEYRVAAEPSPADQRTEDSIVVSYGYIFHENNRLCSLKIGNKVAVLDGPGRMALVMLLADATKGLC